MKTLDCLNVENKSKSKLNKNYFFAGTLFIIALTCLCYFAFDNQFAKITEDIPFLNLLLKAFRHADGMHLFGNMISLLWLGLFFESKIGSLKFILLFFVFVFIGNGACAIYYYLINYAPFGGVGGSSANYALFGIFCIIFGFNYKKYIINGERTTFNRVLLALIIFFFPFLFVVTGLTNPGHLYPLITGLVVGVWFYSIMMICKKIKRKNIKEQK